MSDETYDIAFHWDPVCPFAWITSRWVAKVVAQSDYRVDWRFISLRLVNRDVDYAAHFPEGYLDGHTAGLRMLRMAAHIRADEGRSAMGPLYSALGTSIFDVEPEALAATELGTLAHVGPILAELGLDASYAASLDDESFDAELAAETDGIRELAGTDVGTPIIHYDPPHGPALFGPVISRVPSDDDAVALWEHVVGLARFPSFAELKRSARELPALRAFGVEPGDAGPVEDWHGGSRRLTSERG